MSIPILELKDINKSFNGHRVLCDIDLKINCGEVLCLVGENGSGKSTLIKIISGVYKPDSGSVFFNGSCFSKLDPVISIKQGVQVIYQDFSIFPNLSVAENISLGMQLVNNKKFLNWKNIKKMAQKALDIIGVSMDLNEEVWRLPVSQKQIIAICRSILQEAKIIIMDEPTTALTNKEIERLYEIIRELAARGMAVVFVSHKLDEIFSVCDRITVLRNGKIVKDEYSNKFDKENLTYYMTGEHIAESPFNYVPISQEPIFQVKNLCKKGFFNDISFNVYPGEILGITGQLGCGRTELAKALFGIEKIDDGQIIVHGENQYFKSIEDAKRVRIAYVPEDRLSEGLFMQRSLKDNFSSTTIDRKKKKSGLVDFSKVLDEAIFRINELNINANDVRSLASTFSGGNQQRIVIGKWLATNPEILILNGPTVGVDIKSKSEIHKILKELAKKGMCVIMISDDIGELISTTNRVLVMNQGNIIFERETSEIDVEVLNKKILQDLKEDKNK
ncbi:MAG: sugar ABC transporter ATP-binding protein [Christensenellaceae bacterium]|nr:sugar ABC transporter ATP-binding protein [Christensenellaceae bacterium]